MDGGDYIRAKLTKILSSEENIASMIIEHLNKFLNLTLKSLPGSSSISRSAVVPKSHQTAQFTPPLDSVGIDLDSKCQILIKFKIILLDLFGLVSEDIKQTIMESIFGLLVVTLNESSMVLEKADLSQTETTECRLIKDILDRIVEFYLLNSKSHVFFNKNEKYFDYLIGYLNNNAQVQILIKL